MDDPYGNANLIDELSRAVEDSNDGDTTRLKDDAELRDYRFSKRASGGLIP